MGGYGGESGREKGNAYLDTGGHKVKDQNAIAVGEYFIDRGKYVAFLQEKPNQQNRADLSVEGVHIEVKGMTSTNTGQVAKNIKKAFEQIESDVKKYPSEKRIPGKVIILSKYQNIKTAYKIVLGGFRSAKAKGYVQGDVGLMHNGKLYWIGGK